MDYIHEVTKNDGVLAFFKQSIMPAHMQNDHSLLPISCATTWVVFVKDAPASKIIMTTFVNLFLLITAAILV